MKALDELFLLPKGAVNKKPKGLTLNTLKYVGPKRT